MKRILVLGAGGPAGNNFVSALRLAPEKMYIVGTDISKYHLQWPDLDTRYLLPTPGEPEYIPYLNKIITKETIDFIHAQTDIEVRAISERIKELKAQVFLPSPKTVAICQDKLLSSKVWREKGFNSPRSMLIQSDKDIEKAAEILGLPFWIRATMGAGGKGSTPVPNIETAKHWVKYWRQRSKNWTFMAQEYLPGKNFAFQSLWKNGKLITSQARERIEYIYPNLAASGITGTPAVAMTVAREDVNKAAIEGVKTIDPNASGVFSIDLREDKNGIPQPTEINPGRFFTTSFFYAKAGLNMPYYYIKLAFGERLPKLKKTNPLPSGLYWLRHIDCPALLLKEKEFKISNL